MYWDFVGGLGTLPLLKHGKSRAVSWENPYGEKGRAGMAESKLGPSRKGAPFILNMASESVVTLAEMEGPGVINHILLTVTDRTDKDYYVLRDLVLRMYWDDEETPSVESPLGDFFCCGFGRECRINSIPIAVNPARSMHCYFPMPFKKKAKITLENQHEADIPVVAYQIDYIDYRLTEDLSEDMETFQESFLEYFQEYFHAQWRREPITQKQKDYTILEGVKGKGHYVGTYMALTASMRYWWGEGEIKFYLDGDDKYPTICGTGTEDYFGGAWSFAGQYDSRTVENTYCTPFMGYPYYSHHDTSVHNFYHNDGTLPQRGFYRWHIMDPVLFEEDLRVTIQQIGACHKGNFERQDNVASVAYWYQREPHNPFTVLRKKEERWPR